MYPLNILNFHDALCAVLIAFFCRLYGTADMLYRRGSAIVAYIIHSTWPRLLQPFHRVRGPRRRSQVLTCQLQSTQLCTVQGQRSFGLLESTQEWCLVMFNDTTAERHQHAKERQWPVSALSKRCNKHGWSERGQPCVAGVRGGSCVWLE